MIPSRTLVFALVAVGLSAQTAAPGAAPAVPATRLSLQEAIRLALQNNLQVEVAKESRESTRAGINVELGYFDFNASVKASVARSEDGVRALPNQPVGKSIVNSRSLDVGLSKAFAWGGGFQVNYAPSYRISRYDEVYYSQIPSARPIAYWPYDGYLSATYTQSLLKGFGGAATSRLRVARNNAKAADFTFQKSIIDLVATTESLYWNVVYTRINLDNIRQSLALAQKQLQENQIRVKVGTMAPIEVTSAEASVAQREQDIILAETQFLNAKDDLLRAIWPGSGQPKTYETSDLPSLTTPSMGLQAAERMALDRRVELKAARLGLDSSKIQESAAVNRTLPQLDVYATYLSNAANQIPAEGLGAVNKDLFGSKYPGYSVGLQFSMPIQNRTARGQLSQARAARRSSDLNLRDQELQVTLEVRKAHRNVETAAKALKAAETTRVFREKNLEAERKKFENGMSTNFFVLQRQDELDTAKAAELRAQIAQMNALVALDVATGRLLETRKVDLQ